MGDSQVMNTLQLLLFCSLSLSLWHCANAGHEVLYNVVVDPQKDILPHDLAIIQFDSRNLSAYWNSSVHWNHAYACNWGHQYAFITLDSDQKEYACSFKEYDLSPVWCKVKAMVKANKLLPKAKAFLYLDSDALITVRNYSMTHILSFMRQDLSWDYDVQPIAFNQDGPGWACKNAMNKAHYPYCLNSGTVFWINHPVSQSILRSWWTSSSSSYTRSRFTQRWRNEWPWEQAQMYAIYDSFQRFIMRLSFPKEPFLPWKFTKKPSSQYPTDEVEPWCFSHWPGANCFITHFAASVNQKKRIVRDFSQHPEYRCDTNNQAVQIKYI
jgi:hypothetical protein